MFLKMQNCSICSSLRIFPSQVLNFCTTIFKESIISNNSFLSLSIKQSNAFIILGFLLLIEYYQITKLQISFKKSQNSNKYTYEKRLKPKFYLHLHLDLITFIRFITNAAGGLLEILRLRALYFHCNCMAICRGVFEPKFLGQQPKICVPTSPVSQLFLVGTRNSTPW